MTQREKRNPACGNSQSSLVPHSLHPQDRLALLGPYLFVVSSSPGVPSAVRPYIPTLRHPQACRQDPLFFQPVSFIFGLKQSLRPTITH
jgi:hypothetical protein